MTHLQVRSPEVSAPRPDVENPAVISGDRLLGGSAWLLLAGPAIWYLYFWVSQRAAAEGCSANAGAVATWVTIGLMGATMLATSYYTWRGSLGRGRHSVARGRLGSYIGAGLVVGAVLLLVSLLVGVPTLVGQPC